MQSVKTLLVLLVSCATAAQVAAQQRPNFTGDWTVDLNASQLHDDYRALEKALVRIDHNEPAFKYRRTFYVKGQPFEASFEVSADGKEHRGKSPNGSETVATLRWEGNALVLHQRISDPKAGLMDNKVRYELIDNGRTLRATEDFTGGPRPHHNSWTFRRQ